MTKEQQFIDAANRFFTAQADYFAARDAKDAAVAEFHQANARLENCRRDFFAASEAHARAALAGKA